METIVLALVIVMNGNTYLNARGDRENPEVFQTVQACEKQLKIDEAALSENIKKKNPERFFWTCLTRSSYLETIKRK